MACRIENDMEVFAKIGRLAVAWFWLAGFWQVFRTTFGVG